MSSRRPYVKLEDGTEIVPITFLAWEARKICKRWRVLSPKIKYYETISPSFYEGPISANQIVTVLGLWQKHNQLSYTILILKEMPGVNKTEAVWNTFFHEMAHHLCSCLFGVDSTHEEPFLTICDKLGGEIDKSLLNDQLKQSRYGHLVRGLV